MFIEDDVHDFKVISKSFLAGIRGKKNSVKEEANHRQNLPFSSAMLEEPRLKQPQKNRNG